jgi:cell division protein FtsA
LIPEGNEVEVPSVGDRPSRMMPQRMAGEILGPRARELFELLRDNLRHAGVLEHCIADSCSAAERRGFPAFSTWRNRCCGKRRVLPGRRRWRRCRRFWPSRSLRPCWAWLYYGHRARLARGLQEPGFGSRMKALFAGKGA